MGWVVEQQIGLPGGVGVAETLFVLVGLSGVAVLGRGAFRASLASTPRTSGVLLGFAVGRAGLAVGLAYVLALEAALGGDELVAGEGELPLAWQIVSFALLPSVVEEWLCRGVLWTACRRAAGLAGTVVATALLFALLHGWQGAFALPHRFAFGLLLGWLRLRTGSLAPVIVAHVTNNALVVVGPWA